MRPSTGICGAATRSASIPCLRRTPAGFSPPTSTRRAGDGTRTPFLNPAARRTCGRPSNARVRTMAGMSGLFAEPVPAALARRLAAHLVTETMERDRDIGFESYDRFFPSQDTVPAGGFGNLIALPLQGRPREGRNSVFLDGSFGPMPTNGRFSCPRAASHWSRRPPSPTRRAGRAGLSGCACRLTKRTTSLGTRRRRGPCSGLPGLISGSIGLVCRCGCWPRSSHAGGARDCRGSRSAAPPCGTDAEGAHAAVHVGLVALIFEIVEPHDPDDVACDAAGVMVPVGMARAKAVGHVALTSRKGNRRQEVGRPCPGRNTTTPCRELHRLDREPGAVFQIV